MRLIRLLLRRIRNVFIGPILNRIDQIEEEITGKILSSIDNNSRVCSNGILQLVLFNLYKLESKNGIKININDTGYRNFSQFDEDGKVLFIFSQIGFRTKIFVDIGSSNGINSNCANFALNFGFHGLFIDGNKVHIENGREFYKSHSNTNYFQPMFEHAMINAENINDIIRKKGITGDIDLLSIDIDGNDYWIWKNLTVINPRVVVIESHLELGKEKLVTPYDKDFVIDSERPLYFGSSAPAICELANKMNYHLVGSNRFGFNLIFVRSEDLKNNISEIDLCSLFENERYKKRKLEYNDLDQSKFINL